MKKFFYCIFYILSILLLIGCNDDDTVINTEEIVVKNIPVDDLEVIKQLGLDISTVVDRGDYYLVEGDIAIMKNNLVEYKKLLSFAEDIKSKHAHTNNIISVSNSFDVKIKIDESLKNSLDWQQAILQVISHYNDTPSSLFMREVSDNYDIIIKAGDISAHAQGTFPSADGKAGTTITVNTSSNNLSTSQKIFLIAHELGHNIGFRHTDWIQQNESSSVGANHIPGTPTGSSSSQDPKSVFNSGRYYGSIPAWSGFSQSDIVAINYLYPPKKIESPANSVCLNENIIYNIKNIPSNLSITWEAVSNVVLVSGQGAANATFKATGNGYAKVKAIVKYSGGELILENSGVWIGKPTKPILVAPVPSNIYEPRNGIIFNHKDFLINQGITQYKWVVTGDAYLSSSTKNSAMVITNYIQPGQTREFKVFLELSNACGMTRSDEYTGKVVNNNSSTPPGIPPITDPTQPIL